ncbi:hypothetical protein Z517_07912 [Fonsecaea pedrosoi CBS 271.37]|uniref:Zn(2)-C6 fungal-type domain-containing protein n=1 Tax=Fonsecaea pedrosoi CBS 271.37 TaxID=1442368 RepID=A0A0D2H0A8_9EURO|nr:uncharacterized protein Z517_07912 [Fonsecaea pedrosoi CBS 271.37]KIW78079.1 hypothetical protein Z517_07912 [Fonsecaea pedrosoi CBS 271.37]
MDDASDDNDNDNGVAGSSGSPTRVTQSGLYDCAGQVQSPRQHSRFYAVVVPKSRDQSLVQHAREALLLMGCDWKSQNQSVSEVISAPGISRGPTQHTGHSGSERLPEYNRDEEHCENDKQGNINHLHVSGSSPRLGGGGQRTRGGPQATRQQTGERCQRCILQRKRCDAVKPVCGNCAQRKRDPDCQWPGPVTRSQLLAARHPNPTPPLA